MIKQSFSCLYVDLPPSFSEEVFDVENSFLMEPHQSTFEKLFSLYSQGIECYSIRGDISFCLIYKSKLNSLLIKSTLPSQAKPHPDPAKQALIQTKASINQTAKRLIQKFDVSLTAYSELVNNDLSSQHKTLTKYRKIRNYKSIRKSTVSNIMGACKGFKHIDRSSTDLSSDINQRNSRRKKSVVDSHPFERRSIRSESLRLTLPDNEQFNQLNFYCNANYLTKLNAFVEELSRLNVLKTSKYVESYYSFKELDLLLKESDVVHIQGNLRTMLSDLEKETEKENKLLDQQFKENIRYYSQIETRHSISNITEIVKINYKIIDNIAKII